MSEIDAFPRAVLKHHYKDTPLHGDFTTIQADQYDAIDALVGGTPCQSFSVAGLRGGMADERGNLALEYLRLADRLRPRWLLWENVPGVLSSNGGRDFGAFLGGLGQLGYGFAYRVLDAQYFALAQRRQRVFVVGYLGDWRRAAAVLFEPASLRGHPAPSREKGEGVASPITAGSPDGSGYRNDADTADNLISRALTKRGMGSGGAERDGGDALIADSLRSHPHPGSNSLGAIAFGGNNTQGAIDLATAVNAHGGPHGRLDFESETFVTHSLRGDGFDASEDGTGRGTPLVAFNYKASAHQSMNPGAISPSLEVGKSDGVCVAHSLGRQHSVTEDGTGRGIPTVVQSGVRRLTPRECERLQGFPDDYTLIPYRGRVAADGPRYKALGNSMAVPVMRWIGARMAAQEREIASIPTLRVVA